MRKVKLVTGFKQRQVVRYLLMFSLVYGFCFVMSSNAEVLLTDGFESDTGPNPANWERQWNAESDTSNNLVVSTPTHSGSKALKVYGAPGWSAAFKHLISSPPTQLYLAAWRRFEPFTNVDSGAIGFIQSFSGGTAEGVAEIRVEKGGENYTLAGIQVSENTWIHCVLELNITAGTRKVYVNGTLALQDNNISLGRQANYAVLEGGWGVTAYFDDVVLGTGPYNKCPDLLTDGYESDTGANPVNWGRQWNAASDTSTNLVVSTPTHNGLKALKVHGEPGWAASFSHQVSSPPNQAYISAWFKFEPNTSYDNVASITIRQSFQGANADDIARLDISQQGGVYSIGDVAVSPNTWIQGMVDIDIQTGSKKVYVNGTLAQTATFALGKQANYFCLDSNNGSTIYYDDIEIKCGNYITPDNCLPVGDVNGDGQITPGDAQAAFDCYLGNCPQGANQECADICDNYPHGNGSVTPGDAQGIFNLYLGIQNPCQ